MDNSPYASGSQPIPAEVNELSQDEDMHSQDGSNEAASATAAMMDAAASPMMPPPVLLSATGNPKKRKAPATPTLGEDGLPVAKPAAKRKRKDPAQPGPGKAWRRGIKGPAKPVEYDADGQRVVPVGSDALAQSASSAGNAEALPPTQVGSEMATTSVPLASADKPEKKPRAPRPRKPRPTAAEKAAQQAANAPSNVEGNAMPETQSAVNFTGPGRGVTGFLQIYPFLPKTPKPRRWQRLAQSFATVAGPAFTFVSFKGDTVSPLAKTLAALEEAKEAEPDFREMSETPEPAKPSKPGPKRKKQQQQQQPHPLAQQVQAVAASIGETLS